MKTLNKLVASLMVAAMFAAAFFVSSPLAKADDVTVGVTLQGGTPVMTSYGTWAFGNAAIGATKDLTPVLTTTDPSGSDTSVFNVTGYIDLNFTDGGANTLSSSYLTVSGSLVLT